VRLPWKTSHYATSSRSCSEIPKRPQLKNRDRLLWIILASIWSDWRMPLTLVQPETVIGWHRKGLRYYWRWKSRAWRIGRPKVPVDVRRLIREMSQENPLWRAPRIHGELTKPGIEISQASLSKYMSRRRKPPSQS
jgi:hypothetical protein